MTDCQIFTTLVAAERISKEMDELVDEFSSSVKVVSDDNVIVEKKATWHYADDSPHTSNGWYDCALRLRSKAQGPPRSRRLTLYFDLARELVSKEATDWPHAREALLVVGFDPNSKGNGWSQYSAVLPDGRLKNTEDEKTWDDCRKHVFADGRLLEWQRHSVSNEGWSQRAWLFALPLQRLTNADAVLEQVTKPVVALLSDKEPEIALASTEAVKWNVQKIV